jgi:hypothetical protein
MQNDTSANTKKKWYEKPLSTITLLILFSPIGIYLMWKYDHFSKTSRIIITAFIVLVVIVSINNEKNDKTSSSTTQNKPQEQIEPKVQEQQPSAQQEPLVSENSSTEVQQIDPPKPVETQIFELNSDNILSGLKEQISFESLRKSGCQAYDNGGEDKIFKELSTSTKEYFDKLGYKINYWSGIVNDIEIDANKKLISLNVVSNVTGFKVNYKISKYDSSLQPEYNSNIWRQLSLIKLKDEVIFCGLVFGDDEKGIKESSFSQKGSIREPDFLVYFVDIQKNDYKEVIISEINRINEQQEKQRIADIRKNPVQYLSGKLSEELGDKFISCSLNGTSIVVKCNYENVDGYSPSLQLNLILGSIIEIVKPSPITYNKITYIGFGNLIDKYGNERKEQVIELSYYANTIKKINLDVLLHINLWSLADVKTIHPAVRKILQ